jgi:two-component system NtrC family sensor kinase
MKPNPYGALKKTILTCMILVPFIPFILVLGIGYYNFTTSLEGATISTMKRIVEDHRQMIESFLNERSGDLKYVLDSYPFDVLRHTENLQKVFENLRNVSQAFVDLGIFNADGLHVAYVGPFQLTGRSYEQSPWFQEVIKKGYYISNVFLGYRQIPHFIIAVAKEDSDQRWVIRATIDTHRFNELVKSVCIGKTGEAYLLDADGIFQTERRSGGLLMQKDAERYKYGTAHEGIKTFIETDVQGQTHLYATTWWKEKSWLLVVRQEKSDAFKSLRNAAYVIVMISVLGGGGIVAVAFFLTGRIIRRMERMDAEKEQLGEQLIRASRLAEIGEMAAGFAHEINNPLQIIKNEYTLIDMILAELKEKGQLRQTEDLTELQDSLDQIHKQVERCATITQAILKFGRKSESVPQDLDLFAFIPEVTEMVANKASVHGIAIKQIISQELPVVHVDPGQLQQVLLNLYNNAIDAIIERHGSAGGELSIEAAAISNAHVEIRVTDNGSGIGSENLNKIFTPFFTTKPVGKGTGLGLAVCYGIIAKMAGEMTVDSQENVGTTFSIRIPAAL